MLQQIKLLLLSIITLCRRLCCFSRRRKMSYDGRAATAGNHDELQAVSVVVERNFTGSSGKGGAAERERDWNSWDTTPRTVEEHIEQYRQRMAQPPTPPKEEPEPDFFSELAPTIKPQTKFYLDMNAGASNQPGDFSRLQAQDLIPISDNADLEDWIDDNNSAGGWEELDTSETKQIIREKRRELRNQRQPSAKAAQQVGIGAQRLSGVGGQRVA